MINDDIHYQQYNNNLFHPPSYFTNNIFIIKTSGRSAGGERAGGRHNLFLKEDLPDTDTLTLIWQGLLQALINQIRKKAPVVEQEIWNPQVSRVDNHGIDSSKLRAVPSQLIVLPGLKQEFWRLCILTPFINACTLTIYSWACIYSYVSVNIRI